MATIYLRKDQKVTCWRVQIRRKDLPLLTISFDCEDKARRWAKENEFVFINHPEKYLDWVRSQRLTMRRQREKNRKEKE